MELTPEQEQAVQEACRLLTDVGVTLNPDLSSAEFVKLIENPSRTGAAPPGVYDGDLNYRPPPAVFFTTDQINEKRNKLTRQTVVDALVEHPPGVIVEFPESGSSPGQAVAHRFRIDPDGYVHPKDNIQYSLGDVKGGHRDVVCYLLQDVKTKEPVKCYQTKVSCRSVKKCLFEGEAVATTSTHLGDALIMSRDHNARREVFEKTLGFYTTLISRGCTVSAEFFGTVNGPESASCASTDEEGLPYDIRARIPVTCNGRFILGFDSANQPIIRCENHRRGERAHLFVRNLGEYDIIYLHALLNDDHPALLVIERAARACGYGPLLPCDFVSMRREQKQLCPHWHRFPNGSLRRGILKHLSDCQTRFEIYVPNDMQQCPEILLVSRNPHSHSDPRQTKTPLTVISIFNKFLRDLGWRLADATPRKLALDAGFMGALRKCLAWNKPQDPTLADLHPSLGNLQHTARLIDDMRAEFFPNGTGFQGALDLLDQHKQLPRECQYVRAVETVAIPGQDPLQLIICMLPAMSELLLSTTRPTVDTAFKRANGYEEFEIEAWFPEEMKSIVCARAFITSQTAAAYAHIFSLIFKIAEADTGRCVQFKYIDGVGIETIGADAHKGGALGMGLVCANRCATGQRCHYPCNCRLDLLTPYEHLSHFLRLCTNHYERGIHKLGTKVSPEVKAAMYSLSSAYPLPDFNATKEVIRNGGEKALAWLNDKEIGSPFVFPAIYQPASRIPLAIWQAAPATTNGNEQAHRNINRDGVKLTLLAALWRGFQYDTRTLFGIDLNRNTGIYRGDQLLTHFRRAGWSLVRNTRAQKRKLSSIDESIEDVYGRIDSLRKSVLAPLTKAVDVNATRHTREVATQALQQMNTRYMELQKEAKILTDKGSGIILARDFSKEPALFDHRLIEKQEPPENSVDVHRNPHKKTKEVSRIKPRPNHIKQEPTDKGFATFEY